MKYIIAIAALCAAAAVAAGVFAWRTQAALDEARAELAATRQQLDAASKEARAGSGELRAQMAAQKVELEQAQKDLAAARELIDTDRATNVRLREDLEKSREREREAVIRSR